MQTVSESLYRKPETMKRILIISGSPRKKGNCSILANALTTGLSQAFPDEMHIHNFSPVTHKIAACTGCEKCYKKGECVQNDDLNALVGALEAADLLIWISPLYFGGVPAQLKAIIDRFQLIWARNVTSGESHKTLFTNHKQHEKEQSGLPADRSRPALAYYVSAKDNPFETDTKKTAALLPLRYASNTAGFTLGLDQDSSYALIGPSNPGDLKAQEFKDSLEQAVQMAIDKARTL